MFTWEALNARARGLASRLLRPDQLDELAGAPDLAGLVRTLDRLAYGVSGTGDAPEQVELRIRRAIAERIRVLARWSRAEPGPLRVVFEDEDRRSLRALLRGASVGASAEARLSGLVPTPGLPDRALAELARQVTPGAIAGVLVAWGNPYGSAILEEATRADPDFFLIDLAVNRLYFRRALEGARPGGRDLSRYVRTLLDLENAASALALAGPEAGPPPTDCFIPGGERLSASRVVAVADSGDRAAAAALLEVAFAGTRFERVMAEHATEPSRLKSATLRTLIREWRAAARHAPLGPGPLLSYVLRLRGEAHDLRGIVWGLALGADPASRTRFRVTA